MITGKSLLMLSGINENLSLLEHIILDNFRHMSCGNVARAWSLWISSRDDTNFTCKLMRRLDIALLCVQENPKDRPSRLEVSSMLKNETTNTNSPKKPASQKKLTKLGLNYYLQYNWKNVQLLISFRK
ncbi:hypothetical protein WN943_026140 [Citrus x changshan-huyou]